MQPAGGNVILNFEAADLREVVRNILGDILNENYTIDPAVGGTVTIRTSTGIPREALTATLETLLRANGATMVKNGGLFQVVPQAVATRGNTVPQLGNSTRALPPGFSVQIVPLRYVGVKEMMRLLEPFAKDAQAVRPDELRNLLILGARAMLVAAARKDDALSKWAVALAERRGYWRAVVAIAAKNARMAWAVLTRGEAFKVPA